MSDDEAAASTSDAAEPSAATDGGKHAAPAGDAASGGSTGARRLGDGTKPRKWWLDGAFRFLELFAISGLAFAQPLLDLYGKSPEIFISARLGGFAMVMFALVIAVVPPLALWLLTLPVVVIRPSFALLVHRSFVAGIGGLVVVQIARGQGQVPAFALGAAIAVGFWLLYGHTALVATWLRAMSPAPLVFLALFLFASNSAPLVWSETGNAKIDVPIARKASVVFVLLDELPLVTMLDGRGQIDPALFPNFAALQAQSTWFRNTVTSATFTTQAVPSVLSGTIQSSAAPALYDNYPDTLFTMLGGQYRMNVMENVTHLCPQDLCTRFASRPTPLTSLWSAAAGNWGERLSPPKEVAAEEVKLSEFEVDHDPRRFDAFLDGMRASDNPSLNFIHAVVPHFPFEFYPSGLTYASTDPTSAFGVFWASDETLRLGRIRHTEQAMYADRQLGRIIDKMKSTGLWNTADLVVTADHGFGLAEGHSIRGLANENAAEVLWVPLFMRGPGLAPGQITDQFVTTVDILPTLADMLGASVPWQFSGQSAFKGQSADPKHHRVAPNQLNELPTAADGFISFDTTQVFARVLAYPPIGAGTDDLRIFRSGDIADHIGRAAPPAATDNTAEFVEVDAPAVLRSVGAADTSRPGWVHGIMHADLGKMTVLAVNGVIVGSFRPSLVTGEFWFLIPDTRLLVGDNTLSYFSYDPKTRSLTPMIANDIPPP